MRQLKLSGFYLLMILFSGVFLNSCTKKNEPVSPNYQHFISAEIKASITKQQAITNFTALSPQASSIAYFITSDVTVKKLIYKTTFNDQNIQASGLVCLPKKPGDYPVLSFQNGTNTLHSLAPTEAVNDDLYSIIESIASMGFIVVIPDYIGFGASEQLVHPYLDAKSSNQSILDMLRATQELGSQDTILAKPTKNLFIFGYSQGGWATMELQKDIETNYSSEFNLIASSCGAGPYSINYMNTFITSQPVYPMPYFLAYLLNSYTQIGLVTNPLSDFIQEPYASIIPGLFDGNHTGGSINAALTTNMTDLLTPEFRTEFATNAKFAGLRSAFIANSVTAWNTAIPTHLYHGMEDEVIPVSMSQSMLADFKTAGVPDTRITLTTIPNADHTSAIYQTGLLTILWFMGLK